MANKEVNIFFKVDGLDGYIKDLGDLQNALGRVDESTTEATAATDKLLKSMDDMGDAEAQLDALEGGIKVLAGSAELAAGAIGLLGLEGNQFFESVEENVVNILALGQGAVDLSEGYSKLKKNTELATIANKALNAVAKANPYVLLASALIAVGGALLLYRRNAREAAEEEAKASAEAFKTNLELRERARLAAEVFDAETRRIRITKELKDLDEASLKGRIAQNEFDTKSARDRVAEINEKLRQAGEITVSDEYLNNLQEQYNDALADYNRIQKNANSENEIYNTELERRNNLTQEAIVKERALAAARRQANDEILDEQAELEEQLYRATLDARELSFRDLEDQYYERLNLANGNAELELQIEEQYQKDKAALEERYRIEDDKRNNSAREKELAEVKRQNDAVIAAEDALQAAKFNAAQQGINALSTLAGENEKVQNALFLVDKALAVGKVIVDSVKAKAANLAYAAGLGPAGPAYLLAANQVVNLNTAASLATLAATTIAKFKNGGAPSVDTQTGASPSAAINYSFDQNAGAEATAGGQGNTNVVQPLQAYVLVNDVNNAQQANQQIQNLSRL